LHITGGAAEDVFIAGLLTVGFSVAAAQVETIKMAHNPSTNNKEPNLKTIVFSINSPYFRLHLIPFLLVYIFLNLSGYYLR